jgi:D-3-phosphoglycerate dehydrogenase / 2-oxoglutarate reductase
VKKKILITDRFSFESQLFLEREGPFELVRTQNPLNLPLDQLVSCHGLLIRSKTPITAELFEKARNLQVIVSMTSGFDHIDLPAAQKWGVTVMHTPWAHRESAAQLTWSLVMACASKVVAGQRQIQNGEWARESLKGFELRERTYGILGLGRIGSRVAELAQAFGMKVVAFDPYQDEDVFQILSAERMGLEEVFHQADVISCHVPKTPETKEFLHRHLFESMPKPIVLVNTCRGSIIKEEVLAEALEKKWLLAAAQDVFSHEPLPMDSVLRSAPNLIMTPHIGSQTEEALEKASQMAAEKISRFFISGMTSDTLPPKAAWYQES